MSTTPPTDDQFTEMATQLLSLYEEDGDVSENLQGVIYQELRCFGDRYTDAEVLARGGMKKVSRVFDTKTGRQVAMAELRVNAPSEMYEPFLREARLTALLEHPNIISVHDIGLSPGGLPFFTMDLKRGDSLADILKNNKMPREQLLEIFVKLCDAISYAHSQKVLHLDLKPDNIQVGRFGEVFICDWGLGKIADSDESEGTEFDVMLFNPDLLNNMTLSGEVKGTPGYMAPEQFAKNGVKTFQTDVYALGCLLYAILTQQPPLRGSPDEISEWTLSGTLVSPASAFPNKAIPKALNAVTMKALALKPANRYKSVKALRDDVKNYLSGFSTLAENAGFMKEAILLYKRNRAVCWVGLAAIATVIVTTALFISTLQANIVEIRSARELADSRRQEAEVQRVEAETASELYRNELERNQRLVGSVSDNLEKELFRENLVFLYFDPALAIELSLQRLYLLEQADPSAYYSKEIGFRHFIRQEFALADSHLFKAGRGGTDLWKLGQKYARKKNGPLLDIDQFAALIADLKASPIGRKALMERMLAYDYVLREEKTGYQKVVEAVLRGWNVWWTAGSFEYDPDAQSLTLRGTKLEKFAIKSRETSGQCPLRFLEILRLDAQGIGLHDLNQIKTLRIQELDIRGTKVDDLVPIRDFPALKTLIVSPDQFSPAQLAHLSKELKVVVR